MDTSWADLVGSALLGTERRPPPVAVRPDRGRGGDGAAALALLDAAAMDTVRRRAGMRPAVARERPAAADDDPRPPLPPAAARRLEALLADRSTAGGSGGRRGAAPNLAELLPQWLATARRHGYAAPAVALPALLDASRARTALRADAVALAGPRGLWLARLNPEWKFALRTGARGLEPPVDDPDAVQRLWAEGLFAERIALLTRLRRRDTETAGRTNGAGTALALLLSTWRTERAEDRLMFLDSLREGLSPRDERFLEEALSDRSRNVRSTAAELLSALPDSALAARMAERARSCVALDAGGITVEAPYVCDVPMERDGVVALPPSGRGERAWWFGQLVDSAPLRIWAQRLGGRSPEEIVALPVRDDWQPDLHAAWWRAAVRQRNPEWARALLGPAPAASSSVTSVGDPARLLSVLPERERADWVARFIASDGLTEAFQMLVVCGVPWADPLGRAVIDALDTARDAGNYPWSFSGVMGLAERCLDPSAAERITGLTSASEEGADASPGASGYWAEAFLRIAGTLRLRATLLEELEPPHTPWPRLPCG